MPKNKLVLMCGLPRSGKSTWVKKHSKEYVVVSPDEIRDKIFGHQFHRNAEPFVWAFAEGMVRLLLSQGKSVIIDATNLNYETRKTWFDIAIANKVKYDLVWIKTPLKECIKRNNGSARKVPEDILVRMALIFENPGESNVNGNLIEIPTPKKRELASRHVVDNYYSKEAREYLDAKLKDN